MPVTIWSFASGASIGRYSSVGWRSTTCTARRRSTRFVEISKGRKPFDDGRISRVGFEAEDAERDGRADIGGRDDARPGC